MHIPDGFLDTKTWTSAAIASSAAVGYAVYKTNKEIEEKDIPLMGVLSAFIFAAQMLNFPVAGGTSGHFLGAALSSILLGPWKAMLVMLSVISIQAILFGDGGITALGANIFNMAILAPFAAFFVFKKLKNINFSFAILMSGFISILMSAIACTLELAASGTAPLLLSLSMMTFWHVLIGLGEGIITTITISYLLKVRPDLIREQAPIGFKGAVVFAVTSAVLALFISPFASSLPDGLEFVAGQIGFLNKSANYVNALIPNYMFPGLSNEAIAIGIAGIIGVMTTLIVSLGVMRLIRNKASKNATNNLSGGTLN